MKNSLYTTVKIIVLSLFPFFSLSFPIYPQDSPKNILRGDKLAIKVVEQEDLNGNYTVSPDGTLEFPLIPERISAEGLTYEQLAAKVKEKLEAKYFYKATVTVSAFTGEEFSGTNATPVGGVVYVYGMVSNPGTIKIPDDETLTVSKVIIRSGGFKEFANKKAVKLVRKSNVSGKSQTTRLNMVEIIDKGKIDKDVAVRDGDYIVVPEKFFNF